jgi:hypothetical protein
MDVQALTALILLPAVGAEETFVLFDGPTPVGTASLAAQDLDARPDLIPTALIIDRCPLPFGDRSDACGIGDEGVPG